MPRSKRSLFQLPLLEDTWLVGTSRLRAWVKDGDRIKPTQHRWVGSFSSVHGSVWVADFKMHAFPWRLP